MKYSHEFLQAAIDCMVDDFIDCEALDYAGLFCAGGEI